MLSFNPSVGEVKNIGRYSWLNLDRDKLVTKDFVAGESRYKINREAFTTSVSLPVAFIPLKHVKGAMKVLKKLVPDLMKVPQLHQYDQVKCVLLDPDKLAQRSNLIGDDAWRSLTNMVTNLDVLDKPESHSNFERISINYVNYTMDTIFNLVLPADLQVSGFSIIGHIVHFNMKNELLPYRFLIGEILLDKTPNVRTVVNKTATIDNTYRTFGIELIAGEPDYIATVREHGCTFKLNFAKVYWNSRLSTEHHLIASKFRTTDRVYDVFAGVGPFAIPAAKNGARFLANDLNPESFYWLKENVIANQSKRKGLSGKLNITPYNFDGREFIRKVLLPDYINELNSESLNDQSRFTVLMNLPGLAVEFLDAFASFINDKSSDLTNNDIIQNLREKLSTYPLNMFCYFFLKSNLSDSNVNHTQHHTSYKDLTDIRNEICNRLRLSTNHIIRTSDSNQSEPITFRCVRNVAPGKDMFCAEFRYNILDSLVNNDQSSHQTLEPKRLKLSL